MQSNQIAARPARTHRQSVRPAPLLPQSIRAGAGARLLGVSEATFWRWLKEREGFPAARRIGPKTTVFDVAELIAWRDAANDARK